MTTKQEEGGGGKIRGQDHSSCLEKKKSIEFVKPNGFMMMIITVVQMFVCTYIIERSSRSEGR